MKIAILLGAVCLHVLCAQQLKDGEFEPYNIAIKDLNSGDFAKGLKDLDAWRDQFPQSDFADTRTALYVQTYTGLNDPAKALQSAAPLMNRDLKTAFPGPTGQAMTIRLLYNATWAIAHSAAPSSEDKSTGEKAARQLLAYDDPIPGVPADKWAEARADMKEKATAALLYLDMLPGIQAMAKRPPDCAAADAAYTKALGIWPEKAAISYELGRALNCESKPSAALYEYQRAAVLDPTLGNPQNDPKKIKAFADNAYIKWHGSDEGLEQLRSQVRQAPLPPPEFTVKAAAEVAAEREEVFAREHPQMALWKKIHDSLAAPQGEQFFEQELKGAAVPQLKGTLVDAKPACRPTQLMVRVEADRAEVELKLEKPLPGKPELNTEIQWEGAGAAFTPQPFLLTMDTGAEKIEGLKTTPCAVRKK
jgi:tetratricopeptide (TPR) repeat protein